MTHQDKLHVLPFPAASGTTAPRRAAAATAPRQDRSPDSGPDAIASSPQHSRPDPSDKLARAIAALRGALEAEVAKPPAPDPAPLEDPYTPVGTPKPRWRAGPENGRSAPVAGRVGVAAGAVTPSGRDHTPREKDPLTRRMTSIHLPDFAMERWLRWAATQADAPPDDVPVALAVEGPHGPVIHACTRAASGEGVHTGARVVDMRALCPDLKIVYADIAGDQVALQKLMLWMRRWCPWTAVDGPTGLILDTTGSDHLWGGEAAMLRDIEEKLSALGFSANLAVAPTHGAAWALARLGQVRDICTAEALNMRIAPLPVRALRLDADTCLLLDRLGLKTVGDLIAVPRISLARRFSRAALPQNPLLRLDQMTGTLAEPLSAQYDPPRFAVQANLAEPVQDPTAHLPALCTELCAGLDAQGFGARRIRVTVFRTDGEVSHVEVATARPSRDAGHICKLFDDKLDAINPGFGFDLITLGATVVEALTTVQTRLDGPADDDSALAQLTDRLTARLGTHAVRRAVPHPSHVPERATRWEPALQHIKTPDIIRLARPVRLFDHPEEVRVLYAVPEGPPAQFVWRRVTHKVIRFEGPERIAPEWWQDMPRTRLRDYYRVEDHYVRRYWIYRHGVLGDTRGDTPRWFVHGVFA
ncbi:Y-family DNA polymerase [Yoonia sp. 208BN28-4]|uniref:Y-family DNA polymerase n=1 Tax=Yoonia sp. 208BN28-4 TaxID=3126505 RepID=UPI00309A2F1E